MIRCCIGWIIIYLCFPIITFAQEIIFSASASSTQVGIRDQFQVTFTLKNASEARNFDPPSFQGFRIQGGPFQSNSSSFSNVNGKTQQSRSISLTYLLEPSRTGNITVGPASITVNNNVLKSNTLQIQVVKGNVTPAPSSSDPFEDDPFAAMRRQQQLIRQQMQQIQQQRQEQQHQRQAQIQGMGERDIHKNIFIKVEADKTNPYIGEQVTVSYKLYTRLAMNVNLTQLPSLNGFWSQDFEVPNPPKSREELINGQPYQVFLLKKSALFPQQSGKLELDAAKAEGIVRIIEQTKGANPFADDPLFSLFMDDPFFNQDAFTGYNYKDVPIKLSSKPIEIQVKELPVQNRPGTFTGAVGNFNLKTQLDKRSLSTDDVATFQVQVIGTGNLKLIGAPVISFPVELGIAEPIVNDTITSRNPGIAGIKNFTYTISPQVPGTYTIPAIEFAYYDIPTKQYKTLRSQPQTIEVVKGKNYIADKAQTLPGDIHPIVLQPSSAAAQWQPTLAKSWYWSLYLAGLLLCVLLIFRKNQIDRLAGNEILFKHKKANKVAWKRLSTARKLLPQQHHKAFYEEISKAIWLYLSDKLNIPLASLSKATLAAAMRHRAISDVRILEVEKLITECEMALYSQSGGQQQRQHTLDETSQLIGDLEQDLKTKPQSVHYAG